MLIEEILEIDETNKPQIIGSGLVTLDVIMKKSKKNIEIISLQAGGTCGNVLTILSFFGWNSYPIVRFNNNFASIEIVNDLKKWGVLTDYFLFNEKDLAPIIIEKIYTNKEIPTHSFSFICPKCNAFLPRYRAATLKQIKSLEKQFITNPSIFFFDRVSAGNVKLAKRFAEQGTLVVFEPPKERNSKLFNKAIKNCHILKYSNQRNGKISSLSKDVKPDLEIITLGAEGLEYRFNYLNEDWKTLEPFQLNSFKDSAGAGDWCSAGLLHIIGQKGLKGLQESNMEKIEFALNFGQALAALNCKFYGARGLMYSLNRKEIISVINKMFSDKSIKMSEKVINKSKSQKMTLVKICPRCNYYINIGDLHKEITTSSNNHLLNKFSKFVDQFNMKSKTPISDFDLENTPKKRTSLKVQSVNKEN
ncbi:MAG: hypothetical protein GF308_10310 [Candidatus Heimdallarchaeota archaeon]|nr:hypothetical protein [Candidatus Heimdallarchaeota archaeon]